MDGERMCEMTQGMSQRISDEQIKQIMGNAAFYSPMFLRLAKDLTDARAEIAQLKALSASQEEAHALRDAGASL